MKSIKGTNNKDRIICVSEAVSVTKNVSINNKYRSSDYITKVFRGRNTFYYQPVNTRRRTYLFSTKQYNQSVADLFANKGILIFDDDTTQSRSISLGELYKIHDNRHNFIIDKILNRICMMLDNVIRYEMDDFIGDTEYHNYSTNRIRSSIEHDYEDERIA